MCKYSIKDSHPPSGESRWRSSRRRDDWWSWSVPPTVALCSWAELLRQFSHQGCRCETFWSSTGSWSWQQCSGWTRGLSAGWCKRPASKHNQNRKKMKGLKVDIHWMVSKSLQVWYNIRKLQLPSFTKVKTFTVLSFHPHKRNVIWRHHVVKTQNGSIKKNLMFF